MVDSSSEMLAPKEPSSTDTHTLTTPSDSETLYSSISKPMTATVIKRECSVKATFFTRLHVLQSIYVVKVRVYSYNHRLEC